MPTVFFSPVMTPEKCVNCKTWTKGICLDCKQNCCPGCENKHTCRP